VRHPTHRVAAVAVATIALVACAPNREEPPNPLPASGGAALSPEAPIADPGPRSGTVVETMSSGGYTYVLVSDGSKEAWAAAPQLVVAVGNRVTLPGGYPMRAFHSKTLNRTFDVVHFVERIEVVGGGASGGPLLSPHTGSAAPPAASVDVSNVAKADGGQTVAELYAGKDALEGNQVAVRGKVVKVANGIMGKNWLHIRDGSGAADAGDLTVTTTATASIGDTVLARGKLGVDRDFGYGYQYAVIVEDASVTRE